MEWPNFQQIPWHQKCTARERIYFPVIVAIICIGFLKACVVPSYQAIGTLQEKIALLEQEERLLTRTVGERVQGGEVKGETLLRGNVVGHVDDLKNILKQISKSNFRRGVDITKIDLPDWEIDQGLIRQGLDLQLEGSYFATLQYVERLETLHPPFVIEHFSLVSGGDNVNRLSVTLNGSFYAEEK